MVSLTNTWQHKFTHSFHCLYYASHTIFPNLFVCFCDKVDIITINVKGLLKIV